MKQISLALAIVAVTCAACGGNDITGGGGPVLRSNPGGPYSGEANRNISMSGLASTPSTFPIAHYFWNCGQTPHNQPCTPDSPTPVFNYVKTGKIGSPNAVYTVTLTIEDTMGNRNSATTQVSVSQIY